MTSSSATVAPIPTRAGASLAGRWFPTEGEPRGAVLIVPAMAVPSRFYSALASWLAENGYTTLTFDYQGFGDSLTGPMRHARVDMSQWMDDADDALAHLAEETEGLPLTWLGHSLGGKFLPFADHTRLTQAITVVAGSAYWRLLPNRIRWLTPPVLTVAAPIAMRVMGYCPGAWLGLGNDIPAPAMRQWSRWCFDPDYMVGGMGGQDRAAAVRVPITAVSFSDDEMITRQGWESVHSWFVNSDVTRVHYTPEELGVQRLGHFGLFRSRNRDLWEDMFLPRLPVG